MTRKNSLRSILILAAILCILGGIMTSTSSASQGFRPPAVPLITVDPYFSVWSMADKLSDDFTKHWTGVNHTLAGMARIDGKTYRFMSPVGDDVPAMEQVEVRVLPTRSIYQLTGGGVHLTITFTTPLLLDDLEIMSRPASYIEFEAKSADGKDHDVTLYVEATGEFVVDRSQQEVEWSRFVLGGEQKLNVMRMGSAAQPVLQKSGDDLRIDWGYLYLVFPNEPGCSAVLNSSDLTRKTFAEKGCLPDGDDLNMPKRANDGWPAMACTMALGKVGSKSVSRLVTLVVRRHLLRRIFPSQTAAILASHWMGTE